MREEKINKKGKKNLFVYFELFSTPRFIVDNFFFFYFTMDHFIEEKKNKRDEDEEGFWSLVVAWLTLQITICLTLINQLI